METATETAFLALDVGNTAVKGGLFVGESLARIFHVEINLNEPSSEAAGDAWTRALEPHLDGASIGKVGLASVVPEAVPVAERVVHDLTGAQVVTVDTAMPLPFEMAYDTPQTLGADRLAAAAAGWVRYAKSGSAKRSVIAIDAGTAVTYDVVDASGVYRGGAIAAGPVLTQRALRSGTAQLPTVPLVFPSDVIGTTTRDAMQSGIMWGFVDGVRGMLARLRELLDDDPIVLVTGGWSPLLADHLDAVDHVIPHLVLDGVRILVEQPYTASH
ncbi:type III pantothenate kinase [Longibacter salinarum]|uniref:Type III pantothenate kinase n=1 Tax=Longibacter salinarum TaxID=1850348 RepID=A0A2A8CUD3_9BACT|nr:type III pantothenate kinase [Longibacter salinarum]PEN11103.1 type III pantothenate kinase [Longibacter salinarum]